LRDISWKVKVFYHPDTLKQIVVLRNTLIDKNDDLSFFIKGLMLGLLHGSSKIHLSVSCSHAYSMNPYYVRRYIKMHKLTKPYKDVISCLAARAKSLLKDGTPKVRGYAYLCDSTRLPFKDETFNLIITSPPYFNKHTYAKDNWLRLWFLGFDDYRKVSKKLCSTTSKRKYTDFATKYLKEMYRVLKDNSACFIVVGKIKVREELIDMADFLGKIIEKETDFRISRIIYDFIPHGRKYMAHIPKNMGVREDRILELHKGTVHERCNKINWNINNARFT